MIMFHRFTSIRKRDVYKRQSLKGTLLTGIFGGAAAVVISTPLNIIFWGGTTGNLWGDLAYAAAVAKHFPLWQASTIDEIIEMCIRDRATTYQRQPHQQGSAVLITGFTSDQRIEGIQFSDD